MAGKMDISPSRAKWCMKATRLHFNSLIQEIRAISLLTVIGAPVLRTDCPLTKPSVPSIAIVLKVFSPKCCATSKTSLTSWFSTSKAVRIAGNSPSKCTSTTAPITCTHLKACPYLALIGNIWAFWIRFTRLGAGKQALATGYELDLVTALTHRNIWALE